MMRDNAIALLAVQETHLTDELASQFEELFGNSFKLTHSPDPRTSNARGVAVVLNRRLINTRNSSTTTIIPGRALSTSIPWLDNQNINILTTYAPNPPRDNKDFWKKIFATLTLYDLAPPDILLGDFNLVEDALDRLPSSQDDTNATEALRDFRLKYGLIDGWRLANPESKGYTWSRDSDGAQSRIDRIYVREEFFNECKDWEITTPPIPTDHDMVSARIATPSTPDIGRGRWAIPPRLFKIKQIKEEIQTLGKDLERKINSTNTRTPGRNPQTWLKEFKLKTMNAIRNYEKKTQPKIKIRISNLQAKLHTVRNDPSLHPEEIKIASTQIKKEIQCLVKETHQYKRDQIAAIDAAEGEIIGKTWSRRSKDNKPRDTIKTLIDPTTNTPTQDAKKMAQIAAKYHNELQYADYDPHTAPNELIMNEILGNIKSKITEENKTKLSESISESDVRYAIRNSANDKAPGLDGIPNELWKLMDDQFRASENGPPEKVKCNIVWILTRVYQDIEVYGMDVNAKLNEGCISPIYKKKDPEDIANYRPITLLNTDYKIFTKALSLKLAAAAPAIINPDQAGFIPGRSIFDQVKTTKLVVEYMNRTNKSGAVIALDQEKAYDKILHPYLWAVLEKFGLPDNFIKTIQSLYDNAVTTVMINGEMSTPYIVCRGVRQGDALSCLLFDIAIEPLAELIRKSPLIRGIHVPGTKKKQLKVKLFADDTTVFMSEEDNIPDLQSILATWCKASGAKFNAEKTEIIPLGNPCQRRKIIDTRKLNDTSSSIPDHVHIAKDGEPVRILGAWLGNKIDQAVTWAPIVENCCKRLKRWGAAKHTLEGRRLIIQMQVAGVTQYLTKVQGMPKNIENNLDNQVRRFLWYNETTDTINRKQMQAPHKRGGKKVLNLAARNKAIHLTWLKSYLDLSDKRPTWAFFADAIIGKDIPNSLSIDEDPESRIMPIIQKWHTKTKNSSLPEDIKDMLKLAKDFNVQVASPNPSREAMLDLPIWYHIRSESSVRRLYRTKTAKCLRKKHGIRLVRDALRILENVEEEHRPAPNCTCESCKNMRSTNKCPHPSKCTQLTAKLLRKIYPKWNPIDNLDMAQDDMPDETQQPPTTEERTFERRDPPTSLKNSITIFGGIKNHRPAPRNGTPRNTSPPQGQTTVYTDGACQNNGDENASAGLGVWYGTNDSRNLSMRVPLAEQSNQTGELMAVLMAVKNHPPNEDLKILSDSRYVIDGLTKHNRRWEQRNWIDTHHGNIFQCITAWMKWRSGKTAFQWVKGHSGIEGNEEADKLANIGANLEASETNYELEFPNKETPTGAVLSKLEQRDFYRIINGKEKIPIRTRTTDNLELIRTGTQTAFGSSPSKDAIWLATKHKDLSRKVRDFLWKATQSAYKIGKFWLPIAGLEQRGICPLCNEIEDMDHILTKCSAHARSTAWNLANEIWMGKFTSPLPNDIGKILGCALANFQKNDKPDKGKNRLYRILVSETAYLIWKMRNERRIRDNDTDTTTTDSIKKRLINVINKRLTIDRFLTDKKRFGKRALCEKLVKATWKYCLHNEEALPDNWPTARGVLVGISLRSPPVSRDRISVLS